MAESQEFLAEKEARELLQTFLGSMATSSEISSYDDFLSIVEGSQLPLAIGSLISHHGTPNPHVPNQVRVSARSEGWRLFAYNENRDYYNGTTVSRQHRKFAIGPRERSLVMFHSLGIKGAMALEDTTKSHDMYLLDQCAPDYAKVSDELANAPIYSYSGDSDVPTSITSFAIMGAEAILHAPETMTGFLRVSGNLVNHLLVATKE